MTLRTDIIEYAEAHPGFMISEIIGQLHKKKSHDPLKILNMLEDLSTSKIPKLMIKEFPRGSSFVKRYWLIEEQPNEEDIRAQTPTSAYVIEIEILPGAVQPIEKVVRTKKAKTLEAWC